MKLKALKLPGYILFEHKTKRIIFPSSKQHLCHFRDGLYLEGNIAFYVLNGVQYDYPTSQFKDHLNMLNYKERRMHESLYDALKTIHMNKLISKEQKELFILEERCRYQKKYRLEGRKLHLQIKKERNEKPSHNN